MSADIPRPRSNDPETQRFYDSVRTAFRSLTGDITTLRSSVHRVTSTTGGTGTGTGTAGGTTTTTTTEDPCTNAIVPSPVTGISTSGAFGMITIKWALPTYAGHKGTEIWAGTTTDQTKATLVETVAALPYFSYVVPTGVFTSRPTGQTYVGAASGNTSADAVAVSNNITTATSPVALQDATVYFWLRHVSACDKGTGPWSTIVTAKTAPSVDLIGQTVTANANYFINLLGLNKVVTLLTDLDKTIGGILQGAARTESSGKTVYDDIKTVKGTVNDATKGVVATYTIANGTKVTVGDNGSGLVKQVNQLSYDVTNASSTVKSGFQSINDTIGTASTSGSILYRINTIETNYVTTNGLSSYAKVTDLKTSMTNAYGSLSQAFKQLTARFGSVNGGICYINGNEDSSKTSETACTAANGVWYTNPSSTVQQVADARVGYCKTADGSIDWNVKSSDACVSPNVWVLDPVASIQQKIKVTKNNVDYGFEQLATIAANGASTYTVKTDFRGYVQGFGLVNDGTATSGITFNVDNFYVCNASGTKKAILSISHDSATNKDLIFMDSDVRITKAQITDLAADSITLQQAVTAGGSLSSGAIETSNFVAGSAGWKIAYNGSAEFNSLVVRTKNLEANSVSSIVSSTVSSAVLLESYYTAILSQTISAGSAAMEVVALFNGRAGYYNSYQTVQFKISDGSFTTYASSTDGLADYPAISMKFTVAANNSKTVTVYAYCTNGTAGNVKVTSGSLILIGTMR